MHHDLALVSTVAVGFAFAAITGLLASLVRLPPIVGYLLAGILIGPFTPGFVADTGLAGQLAEIGVMLLMFGVGLHFSLADLMAVRRIAIPGAVAQIAVATAMGAGVAALWGWSLGAGLVFGLSLSVASTVVLLRALEERREVTSANGRIAVGWLIVEDLAMVLALIMVPALANPAAGGALAVATALGITLAKVAAFVVLMLVGGARVVPWLLDRVARTGSRELFTLSVVAVALGIAYGSSKLFDVSLALGAFFAGVVINASDLSHRALGETKPIQDIFAVLFFVSVGMLFDPEILLKRPLDVLVVVAIIMVGKSAAAFLIVKLFRYPADSATLIAASLAQIGEFSFILAGLGVALGLLPPEGRDLVLAGALISITLNPVAFALVEVVRSRMRDRPAAPAADGAAPGHGFADHAILVGFGRVGALIGAGLEEAGLPYVVVELDRACIRGLSERGVPTVHGNAATPGLLEHAGAATARIVVVTAPDAYEARQIVELARALNPAVDTVVRTHAEGELAYLERQRVGLALFAEHELARGMRRYVLDSFRRAGPADA